MTQAYFKWDEDFLTGNDKIDEDHFMLVTMINELLQSSLHFDSIDIQDITDLKEKLASYVKVHFSREEAMMDEFEIHEAFQVEHSRLHREFVEKIFEYFNSVDSYNDDKKLASIAEFLIRWLAYHVLNTDKSLVRQLDNIVEHKMTPEEAYSKEVLNQEASTEPLLKALRVLYRLVSQKNQEIEKKNAELEVRVEERTKELKEANDKLKEMSVRDVLTGLPNRRYVMTQIDERLYEWERYKVPFSILFIDLDKFKQVNDLCGHNCGDRVLVWVAEYLKSHTRKNDIACRLGGDEFVIICPHTNKEAAMAVGDKLNAISSSEPLEGIASWQPSISIGITSVDDTFHTASDLLRKADTAMYKAKSNGGGSISISD